MRETGARGFQTRFFVQSNGQADWSKVRTQTRGRGHPGGDGRGGAAPAAGGGDGQVASHQKDR